MSNIQREIKKASEIREMLIAEGAHDEGLICDMLEGLTDIYEIMDWIIARISEEEAYIEILKKRQADLALRKERFERRTELLRDYLIRAVLVTPQRTVRRPEATLSLKDRGASIEAIDEALLPRRYWKKKETEVVDREALKADIAAGKKVAGVTMNNGGHTLTIRRK